VVSTYPTDVRGPQSAREVLPERNREGSDPDDFSAGFAVWAGTSFSAPQVAAEFANRLRENRDELALDTMGKQAANERAHAAVKLARKYASLV
jgi:hypothetical protein